MRKYIFLLIILTNFLYQLHCKREQQIYEPSPENISYGSLIYASSEVNCKNCHGVDFKGNGPDAKDLDIPIPDLTGSIAPEKTYLDYFKVISVGSEKTIKNGINYHAFYSLTDRSKWALAHYLYSLGKEPDTPEGKKIRKDALKKADKEIHAVYSKNRKWYMGENKPATERENPIPLKELIQNTNFKPINDLPTNVITEKDITRVNEARIQFEEGYILYQNNCQSCHGIAGEGVQGSYNLGLLDESRKEPIRNIARRLPSFIGIPKISKDNVSKEIIYNKHSFYFSDEQWNDLINYIKAITE